MNQVIIIGNLVAVPEIRYTQSNATVTTFTVAVNRQFSAANKEREADFIPIVTWNKLAEICGKNLDKGKKVAVCGRLQVRRYEDKDGHKRSAFEVVAESVEFLFKRTENNAEPFEELPPEQSDLPF